MKGVDKNLKDDWKDFSGLSKLKTVSINDVSSAEEKGSSPWMLVNQVLGGGIV